MCQLSIFLRRTLNTNLKETLKRELKKYYINNLDYEIFHELVLSILNAHTPLKKKHLRANQATFVTKEFRKAIVKRARQRNVCCKKRTEATKAVYNYQQHICVSLPRKSYFENLDVQLVRDNKNFGKTLHPFFPIKSNLKRKQHFKSC